MPALKQPSPLIERLLVSASPECPLFTAFLC
jgi:hypothetical protein